jgi:nucleoside-diphosphate-sugar epimerase
MTSDVALVTGATGFIGSALVEKLIERGYRVKCLIRKTSNRRWLENLPIEVVDGDLFSDEALLPALSEVTHVFHLAGLTKARRREEYFRANGEGTTHLLQLAGKAAVNLKRFVYVSSQAAAGPSLNGLPVTEADAPHPVSIYGESKLAGERACAEIGSKIPWSVVRPPAAYGPRERDIYTYFQQVNYGVRLQLGAGQRWTSIVYVDDLARGIITVAQDSRSLGEIYFIANATPCEWSALGEMVASALHRKSWRLILPTWIAPVLATASEAVSALTLKPALLSFDKMKELQQRHWVCSTEKIRTQLGFHCEVALEEGMARTATWYREHGWL